jgi:hypothetical protein
VYEHIFRNHYLRPLHEYPIFNNKEDLIWPSVLLLFCLTLFVILKISSPGKLINTFHSSYSLQAIKQMEREEFNPFNPVSFILSLNFILMLSFYVYKINNEFNHILTEQKDIWQFIFILTTLCAFLPLKYTIKKIIGFITDTTSLTNELFYNNLVINQSLGLILLPSMGIVELSGFNPLYTLITVTIIILISFVIKLYRGMIFSIIDNRIGILQVFVYLCALELLPFLVFIKFIITTF